jgi:hypothetical protein
MIRILPFILFRQDNWLIEVTVIPNFADPLGDSEIGVLRRNKYGKSSNRSRNEKRPA